MSKFIETTNEVPSTQPELVKINYSEFAIGVWHFERIIKDGELIAIDFKGLYREGVLKELHDIGFFKRQIAEDGEGLPIIKPIFANENRIALVTYGEVKQAFYERCIKPIKVPIIHMEGDMKFTFEPNELRDKYLKQYHLIFNPGFLEHLPSHIQPILEDSEKESYIFFKNTIIKISANGRESLKYSDLKDFCVWEDHIINREFSFNDGYLNSHMAKFISNVSNDEQDRKEAFYSAIGYLLHNHNTETRGQAVLCYDESPSERGEPMGGTGKGVFAKAIKQVRSMAKIDGKKYREDDKFKWQNIKPTTQVAFIDDVHQKFSFEDLHSLLTDGMNVEKKHKDEFLIPPIKTPKFILTSNTILNGKGTTNERRQFIIEFSDHYSKVIKAAKGTNRTPEPIPEEHGCIFFNDGYWKQEDWNEFYSFMVHCGEFYFANGLKPYKLRNVAKNTFMQATNANFVEWIENNPWLKDGEKRKLKEAFEDFRDAYYGAESDFPQGTFTKWLKIYAESLDMVRTISGSNKDKDLQFIPKEERRKVD